MGRIDSSARMRVLSVVGNRPQFVKSAPLSEAFRNAGIDEVVLHTGQHYDPELSQVFFDELELALPAHRLEAGSGTHARQTARMLPGIEDAIRAEEPDVVLVSGDTNSTLAGGLVAAKLPVPVAHVTAGHVTARDGPNVGLALRPRTDHAGDAAFPDRSTCAVGIAGTWLGEIGFAHGHACVVRCI